MINNIQADLMDLENDVNQWNLLPRLPAKSQEQNSMFVKKGDIHIATGLLTEDAILQMARSIHQ